MPDAFKTETVAIAELKPHPRNYKSHPDDQLEHIIASIKEHGFYRNIVIARDGTILAGHGVVRASKKMGLETVPVVRLDVDPNDPRALKLLAGDNEISHLAENDDRLLTELLKEIKEFDPVGLMGTGYDEMMLANLLMVTRPKSEIADIDEAAQWVGLPDYDAGELPLKLIVSFRSEDDRMKFSSLLDLRLTETQRSIWWPRRNNEDPSSLKFEG